MGRISGNGLGRAFVKDLKQMTEFYCDTLGLTGPTATVTGCMFLTADSSRKTEVVRGQRP